jgi:hypothetical protein
MPARPSPLSREARLLLLAAGDPANERVAHEVLEAGVDWKRLLSLAQEERATTIAWRWLQRVAAGRLTSEAELAWRKLAMVSEFQLLRLERRLYEVVELLASRGIDVMLLKGSALAYTTYASFADRPMGDLDLVLRPEQAREAWSLLQTRGWRWPADRWPEERYTAHQHLPPLMDAGGEGLRVELHTDVLPGGHPFQLDTALLWDSGRSISLHGHPVLVPDPLLSLLHLCIHFAWSHQMQWGGWRAFRDVDLLARAEIDWQRFVALARESRAETCCYWTLRLARTLVGAHVPDDVLVALRPALPKALLDRLERHYALQLFPTEHGCPSVRVGQRLWEIGIAPRSSGHGSARPWQVSNAWLEGTAREPTSESWRKRLMRGTLHVARSVGYLCQMADTTVDSTTW